MKRLLLLRHGKSNWDADFRTDHERPLAPRGVRAAWLMGRFLTTTHRQPQHIVTSSAVRARTTVELAATAGEWDVPVEASKALYMTTAPHLLEIVRRTDEPISTLLLAGHEPSWSDLISLAVGGGRFRFPTAAVAAIRFNADQWASIGPGDGTLEWLVTPKLLGPLDDASW